jgi:methylenetetrahydrofolate reductase (NADPH)
MPAFDIDPVHALTLLTLMNRGQRIADRTRELEETPATEFFHGAVFSPFKCTEPEVKTQLAKMELKARAGAQFLITQIGFDARKLRRLKWYFEGRGINVPLLGSVFILRKGAAAAMHRGTVPGSLVTDELLEIITREADAPDKGRAASLERAARQVAVLKGLGFRGAHLEAMVMTFDMVETILGRAAELAGQWEACAEEMAWSPKASFIMGQPAPKKDCSALARTRKSGWLTWRAMRIVHDLLFVKEGVRGSLMRTACRVFDWSPLLGKPVHFLEKAAKSVLFDCRDCGDCALPDLQYLCPQSQCPKQQRNGPCGGSRLDACEVYPDRPCVWVRIFTRARAAGELDRLRTRAIGPRDWRLRDTSAWVNYHLNRDHDAYDFTTFFARQEPAREETLPAREASPSS